MREREQESGFWAKWKITINVFSMLFKWIMYAEKKCDCKTTQKILLPRERKFYNNNSIEG